MSIPSLTETDFEAELTKLAKSIVQKAVLDATPFDERVDAFKALTAYYALRLKHKTGDDGEPDDGFSFDHTGLAGMEQPNGGQAVRSRPRRSAA